MYNIREQVLDVAAANIKRAQPTMPNTAEMHLKWVTKYGGRIHCGIQNRNCSKGPKWYGSYEIAMRKAGGNGNYLLIALSGKNKGQVSKKTYPPNHLKRFIHRNPEIPDSDSEYGSDNKDMSQLHKRVV